MTIHLGDVPAGTTIYIPFATYGSSGQSLTMTGLAVTDIEIYKNGSVTQRASDNGYALLDTDGIDFDGLTGIHGFSVDLSDNSDSGFFSVGGFYWVVVSSITVNSQTVNFIPATFRICAAESSPGVPKVDVSHWLGTAAATPTVAGVPEVDITHILGTAAVSSGTAGTLDSNVAQISGSTTTVTNFGRWMLAGDNGTADSGTTTTLTDTSLDGSLNDNYVGYNLYISSGTNSRQAPRRVTAFNAATDTITFEPAYPAAIDTSCVYSVIPPMLADVYAWRGDSVAATSVAGVPEVDVTHAAGTAWGSGAITAASIASNAITSAKIATDAIGAAQIAADAIDASALAADAVTEIQSGLSTLNAAGVRAAVGLASANLDTQLTAIDDLIDTEVAAIKTVVDSNATKLDTIDDFLDTEIAAIKAKTDNLPSDPADASVIAGRFDSVDTAIAGISVVDVSADVTAIKAKTDSLTFTQAGNVDANIQYVNDVQVTGTGATGDEWGP